MMTSCSTTSFAGRPTVAAGWLPPARVRMARDTERVKALARDGHSHELASSAHHLIVLEHEPAQGFVLVVIGPPGTIPARVSLTQQPQEGLPAGILAIANRILVEISA